MKCVLILMVMLFSLTSSLQLLLTSPNTCLGFEVENDGDKLLFNYHHNPNLGTANFLIYDLNGQILA